MNFPVKASMMGLLILSFGVSPVGAQLTANLENTNLATTDFTLSMPPLFEEIVNPPVVGDGFAAFAVFEGAQNGVDLNGDSDAIDFVVHVRDSTNGTVTNLALAAASYNGFSGTLVNLDVYGSLMLINAPEQSGGGDLNGDGDMSDWVLHIYDHATGKLSNLGVSGGVRGWLGSQLALIVHEFADGMDRNKDGDALDAVVHLYDPASETLHNTELAGTTVAGSQGEQLAAPLIAVSEDMQANTDLNADSDMSDWVLHMFDPSGGPTTNLGIAVENTLGFNGNGMMVFLTREQLVDLNNDSDTLDRVAQIYDVSSKTVINTGLATSDYRSAGTLALLEVKESEQGDTDLNGDGDTLDTVVHVYDNTTSVTHNLGRGWRDSLGGSFHGGSDGRYVLFLVGEVADNNQDLNGDGDITQDENVLHALDAQTMTLHNLQIAAASGQISVIDMNHGFTFIAVESKQGEDLDGDGSADGFPMQFYDAATKTVKNIGTGWFSYDLLRYLTGHGGPPGMAFRVQSEALFGDLNDDADNADWVPALYNFATGETTNFGVAVDLFAASSSHAAFDGNLVVVVSEKAHGGVDLNGDGDMDDGVIFATAIDGFGSRIFADSFEDPIDP